MAEKCERLTEWRASVLVPERFKVLKMSVFPEPICMFKANLIKIQTGFYVKLRNWL